MQDNNLTTVPSPLAGIDPLHELHLLNNYIHVLNDTSFSGYDDLMVFIMLNNKLQYIMDGTFIKMHQLETLFLQNNAIVQFSNIVGPPDKTVKYSRNPL